MVELQRGANALTPLYGLKLLQKLYSRYPYHQAIMNSLINAYIKLGNHTAALALIDNIPKHKTNIQTLKLRAWQAYKRGNGIKEKHIWSNILSKQYTTAIEAPIGTLLQRSEHTISITKQDVVLVCVERNEMLRLPSFLKHYRSLGVSQFFFVDNNSDDGSFEYLLNQDDCHVFWTNDCYAQAGFGAIWQHYLIDTYLSNQWYIIADADELLIYPDCETTPLSVLFSYLSSRSYQAVAGFMLDMFPDKPASQIHNLIESSPYFYNQYQHFHQMHCPYLQIGGGIRSVVFGENTVAYTKTPIAHGSSDIRYLSSTHITTPAVIADITTAVLHFKFIGDAQSYFQTELKRKQHADGALRYRQYEQWFDKQQGFEINKLAKTTKYQNSQQLVELGLIKTSDAWDKFIVNERKVNE